jgi:uncharacterized BrkB/YihY/UPF0761 family membrane protein
MFMSFMFGLGMGIAIGACLIVAVIAKCRLDKLDMGVDLDAFPWAGVKASILSIIISLLLLLVTAAIGRRVMAEHIDLLAGTALAAISVSMVVGFRWLRRAYPPK